MPLFWSTINTNLPVIAASGRIASLLIEQNAKPPVFAGDVGTDSFKITRIINDRNSFLPVIYGRIKPGIAGGSVIRVIMRLHLFTAAFMAVWFGFLLSSVDQSFPSALLTGNTSALVTAGLLLFGVLLVCGGFYSEALKANRLLREALTTAG